MKLIYHQFLEVSKPAVQSEDFIVPTRKLRTAFWHTVSRVNIIHRGRRSLELNGGADATAINNLTFSSTSKRTTSHCIMHETGANSQHLPHPSKMVRLVQLS